MEASATRIDEALSLYDDNYKVEYHKSIKIITLTWKKITETSNLPTLPGIYQIYGDSTIYGENTLLYIGQAVNLAKRPKCHEEEKRINNFSIRYAVCPIDDLNFVEGLLIASNKPSYNNKCIESPNSIMNKELTFIFNEGERGPISLEISNYWWCWN